LTLSIATSDASVGTWTLPDGTQLATNALNTSLGGFDGTVKEVKLQIADFSVVTTLSASNKKLVGNIDLSLFRESFFANLGDTASASALNNNITSIITSEEGINQLYARRFAGGSLTIKTNGGGLWLDNATSLTELNILADSVTSDFSAFNMNSLQIVDLSNLRHTAGRFDISTSASVNTTLTLNTVSFSTISNIDFVGRIIPQSIDLGNYTMNGGLELTNCLITSITPPLGTLIGASNIRNNRFTSFASSLILNGEFLSGNAADLNELIQIAGGTISGNFNSVSANLNSISLGSAVISSSMTGLNLSDNNMTTAEVDAMWIELDRVAIVTGIARTLNVGGNNDAPSAISEDARDTLVLKGYLLTI
jgi:hypothetical protein